MIRALCLVGGLAGAAGLSQFPEFSQQYLQRVAGQMDELTRDLKELDAMALSLGMGREDRLEQMAQTPSFEVEETYWREKIARHARLQLDLTALRDATPLARIAQPQRFNDPATLQAVWQDFQPALPLSVAGGASAGVGFLGGWAGLAGLWALLVMPFRRLKRQERTHPSRKSPVLRADPPVTRPTLLADPANRLPKLAGVRR
ncbi:DUF2937 family protein [Yoonia sp. SS1-5]|uniref:DUF2937 family protein n=1 Tax=Yoonia rhodophyticola TaxID=3137370 RepID=A0AAN0MI98_9RHOB